MKQIAMFAAAIFILAGAPAGAEIEAERLQRLPEDEIIYFALPDRFENGDPSNDEGGIAGGRLDHGFDPTHKGFYHGGDLKGLTARLDYIAGLGATAIWLGPIYRNKPVQGPPGEETAGYHGYWITDFTRVDPHFGTSEDLKAFVAAAHDRGVKIYLDIITNHTADVIQYRECHDAAYEGSDAEPDCPYRAKADYPYTTRGEVGGEAINDGFMGDRPPFQTARNFATLTRPDFAYTPFVPDTEKDVKVPSWLNDPIYYHNRSDSTWVGESVTYGDFAGLDDLMTEHPRVVDGMIDIFGDWIETYKIDGFRVDTAKHVNPEFWRAFVPAMLARAEANGIPNFYIFGEAWSPEAAGLARYTRVDRFPTVLDFAFQAAVRDVVADGAGTRRLEELFAMDDLYEGGQSTTIKAPVFIGNHDMGRFAMFARQADASRSDSDLLKRTTIAHAMMFFLRGAPVIYYGDEQGFNGDGGDQASREDMFPSRTASFNDNDLIGADATTEDVNFDPDHPLYRAIAEMSEIYKAHQTLRRGRQTTRHAEDEGGLFAVSRLDAETGPDSAEYLVVFNASDEARKANIAVDPRSARWRSIAGSCRRESKAIGSVSVSIPAWSFIVCRSNDWSDAE